MDRKRMTNELIEIGSEVAGGAVAAFLDARYPNKKVGPATYGQVFAIAGCAVGVLGFGGKYGRYVAEAGGGAAAYEVGKYVASKTKAAVPGAVSGESEVGALPMGNRVATAQELQNSLAMLART